jgi:hypothetical protein
LKAGLWISVISIRLILGTGRVVKYITGKTSDTFANFFRGCSATTSQAERASDH